MKITSVAFSSDGAVVAGGVFGGDVTLWDTTSGDELKTIAGFANGENASVAFSPDGRLLARGLDKETTLWDTTLWQKVRTLTGDSGAIQSVTFSAKSDLVASVSSDKTIRIWNAGSGQEIRTLRHSTEVLSAAFSPDGKTLAVGCSDGSIKFWEVASGHELATLKGHSYEVNSVAFSPDGNTLVSGSLDATVKLWDVRSASNLASLIVLDEDDWLVVTPDGLFDGSTAAWHQVLWRFSTALYDFAPVEAFFNDFYYPGLLSDFLAGKRPKAPPDISQKDRRQPQLKLGIPDLQSGATFTSRMVRVKVDITQAPAGARDVRLFRNGSLVKFWRGDALRGQRSVSLETTIPIVSGENKLTVYAFNHDNIKSSDSTVTITGAESLRRNGVGYVLAVGVNEYANAQYNLKYAVADAQDFGEELKRQQTKLNNYERVEVILLTDREATKANILKSLADLSAKIQPEDALVIFFAGHGTAQQNRFYLIPRDLGYTGSRTQLDRAGLQGILAHSISDEEIERAVEGIDAGQMVLVIDACNSGQALEAEEKRRGPMNSKGLAQLAYEKGMYILTAAQSYQAAQEASRLGHGYLTYALVEEGLKTNAADKEPKDGQVLLREWLDFATERVPQMQQDILEE
ncbi:MAG: caspase family protein, partial [Acidobacteriota bacterium]